MRAAAPPPLRTAPGSTRAPPNPPRPFRCHRIRAASSQPFKPPRPIPSGPAGSRPPTEDAGCRFGPCQAHLPQRRRALRAARRPHRGLSRGSAAAPESATLDPQQQQPHMHNCRGYPPQIPPRRGYLPARPQPGPRPDSQGVRESAESRRHGRKPPPGAVHAAVAVAAARGRAGRG